MGLYRTGQNSARPGNRSGGAGPPGQERLAGGAKEWPPGNRRSHVNRCELVATPFFGALRELPSRRFRLFLEAVNLLEKSHQAAIEPVPTLAAATAQLLANIPFTDSLDDDYRQSLLDAVGQLVATAPVRRLRFRRDLSFLAPIGWHSVPSSREEEREPIVTVGT